MTYVDQYYRMDPETDDVLANGRGLKTGMKILAGTPGLREAYKEDMSPSETYRYDKFNRWLTIDSDVHFFKKPHDILYVSFVALYEDGTKMPMHVAAFYPWLVKKDSIPNLPANNDDLIQAVLQQVQTAMRKQDAATYHGLSSGVSHSKELKDVAVQTANNIVEIFKETLVEGFMEILEDSKTSGKSMLDIILGDPEADGK